MEIAAFNMLPADKVAALLEKSLTSSDILAYAVVTPNGTVLESRENSKGSDGLFPQVNESEDPYKVSCKLQTKVYALFAAEYYHLLGQQQPNWCGAEAHERRLVMMKLGSLLLLAVGSNEMTWGHISNLAQQTRELLLSVSPFEIDVRGI